MSSPPACSPSPCCEPPKAQPHRVDSVAPPRFCLPVQKEKNNAINPHCKHFLTEKQIFRRCTLVKGNILNKQHTSKRKCYTAHLFGLRRRCSGSLLDVGIDPVNKTLATTTERPTRVNDRTTLFSTCRLCNAFLQNNKKKANNGGFIPCAGVLTETSGCSPSSSFYKWVKSHRRFESGG